MISKEDRFRIQAIRNLREKATPGPYTFILGRVPGMRPNPERPHGPVRFDIVPVDNESLIVAHCHPTNPKTESNPNWENDCAWFSSTWENFDFLASLIDSLDREVEELKLKLGEIDNAHNPDGT